MKSSAEIAREKYEAKIEQMEKDRLALFERGLESLDTFDMDRIEKDISHGKYREDALDDLKKVMNKGNIITKWGRTLKDEDADA